MLNVNRIAESSPHRAIVLGDCLRKYSESLGPERSAGIQTDSLAILDKLLRSSTHRSSGLVVGRVQSGKTSSIIGVISAARDNDFPIVVVASGLTELLQSQTTKRITENLGLETTRGDWILRGTARGRSRPEIVDNLENWFSWWEGVTDAKPPTMVFVPLKNVGLSTTGQTIRSALEAIGRDVPVLVVDDESDLASPNNFAKKNLENKTNLRSPTAKKIEVLFECSTLTKYLMYTATPQANLLMEISDQLNPDFCHLLEPGPGYLGFDEYFLTPSAVGFVRSIPLEDITTEASKKMPGTESTRLALATFIVGCAMQLQNGEFDVSSAKATRSMMIQVSRQKAIHAEYEKFVRAVIRSWKDAIVESGFFFDDGHLFLEAFSDLSGDERIESRLEDLIPLILKTLRNIRVVVMNSENEDLKATSQTSDRIKWNESPFWILVGSMLIDRGFTVEGLQVSYMPRNPSKNEDTLTQRARFFGYHTLYKQYIRLFMPEMLRQFYRDAGLAAKELLEELNLAGGDLKAWRRKFANNPGSRPTANNRQGRSLVSGGANWVHPIDLHVLSEQQRSLNLQLITGFQENLLATESPAPLEDYRIFNPDKAHIFEGIAIEGAEKLLRHFAYRNAAQASSLIDMIVKEAKQAGHAVLSIVFLDKLETDRLKGKSLDPASNMETNMLMSGSSSTQDSLGRRKYPGDREVFSNVTPTLQLRIFRAKPFYDSNLVEHDFAWWAWRMPGFHQKKVEVR